MPFNASPCRPALRDEQQSRHTGTWPTSLAGDDRRNASLPVEPENEGLHVGNHRLDLDYGDVPRRDVAAEDVHRPAFSTHIERRLHDGFPAGRLEPRNRRIDDPGMRFVQQAIERLALPPHLDLEIRLQCSGDHVQGFERNASDRTSLDSADPAIRHAGALGEVDLTQLLPAA